MSRPLRVLMVEDSPDDALLLERELRRGGWAVTSTRVQTEADLRDALAAEPWDLVVSDFSMPSFDALGALRVLQASGLDLPFLVVSGTIGEEVAVEVLKAGAHDFVLKTRLARFLPAVERELREAAVRRERRKAESALRDSEETHRRIVETTQEGIWQLDSDARTIFANHQMASMLRTTAEEMCGQSIGRFVSGGSVTLGEAAGGRATELELRRSDGTTFWGSVSFAPVVGVGGVVGTLAMVADVTEQRRMRTQLMMADRMASVGLLAAGVAHEINNPLSAVLGNLELAAHGGSGAPTRELVADALEAAGRVRLIVQDLMLFSRAEEDSRAPVDVHRVVQSALRMARTETRHRAAVVLDLQPVPLVMANEARLGQVMLNLVVNAAQSIPEGDAERNRITVQTRTDAQHRVVVEVRDTGSGMTPDVVANLFRPFFTTKPRGVGTGLGLSICERIVASLGGVIEAETTAGQGSVFRIPLPPTDQPPEPAHPPAPSPAPAGRARVLVVDDEAIVGTLLKRILTDHQVVVVSNADDAERALASTRFDAVFCDLMMPQRTGMDLYEDLKRVNPEQAARFVFVTGGAFTVRARAFLEDVPNHRVDKPFSPAAIRSILATLEAEGDRPEAPRSG